MNKNEKWIIDSMIGDKGKFIALTHYDGNSVRFDNDASCLIKGTSSIKLIERSHVMMHIMLKD